MIRPTCRSCGRDLDRRPHESFREFYARQICSTTGCTGHGDIPIEFPYVDGLRLDQAPPCCRRCGGLWRRVDEGYVCRTCNRRWRAAECLLAMVGRALTHTDRPAEVWMTLRRRPSG